MQKKKGRPYTKMYMEQKYRERRQVAIVVIVSLIALLTMMFYPAGDAMAEGVYNQLEAKSNWAVEYSKANGDYPF